MKIPTVLIISTVCMLHFACNNTPSSHLVAALQNGNWETVHQECKQDSVFKKPETMCLRGHAALMLNLNNESYKCLNGMDSVQRQGWLNWTTDLAQKHPTFAVAHYLLGDAQMRSGNKLKALRSFNRAIELDGNYSLAYNARATLLALDSKYEEALRDANFACENAPGVAEFLATKANILYQNRGVEGAEILFNDALKIAPAFALALNGLACSEFFDNKGKSVEHQKHQFERIAMKMYSSSLILNLPSFRENTRSLTLELENYLFPELEKNPLFRVSDFLDWETLRRSSRMDNDFFNYVLGKPLPDSIDSRILRQMNLLLRKKDLFEEYAKRFPGAFKQAWKKEAISGCKASIECFNRLVIEKIYAGLMAPFLDRQPGMNIKSQSQIADTRTIGAKLYDALDHTPDVIKSVKEMGDITATGLKDPKIKLITHAATKIIEVASLATQIGLVKTNTNNMLNSSTHQNNMAILERYKPDVAPKLKNLDQNPGGVFADITAQYVDDLEKPYFLLLNYGLAYDYFQ